MNAAPRLRRMVPVDPKEVVAGHHSRMLPISPYL